MAIVFDKEGDLTLPIQDLLGHATRFNSPGDRLVEIFRQDQLLDGERNLRVYRTALNELNRRDLIADEQLRAFVEVCGEAVRNCTVIGSEEAAVLYARLGSYAGSLRKPVTMDFAGLDLRSPFD